MSSYTVRVLNSHGRCVATYDNATVDNDIDPPYVILRNTKTDLVVALIPTTFILDIAPMPESSKDPV